MAKCTCKTKKQLIASIRSMCMEYLHTDIEKKLFWKFAKIKTTPEALLGECVHCENIVKKTEAGEFEPNQWICHKCRKTLWEEKGIEI